MNVTLVAVTSLDGKITRGSSPGAQAWASPEDQAQFARLLTTYDRIVMGSKTYEAARAFITADPHRLRVIATRTPQRYANKQQPGLIFTAASPQEIVAQAEANGCKSLLLVGGAETYSRFIDAGLVSELLITIEPLLFGSGKPLISHLRHTIPLRLISIKQLNKQGTLLAHYLVLNPTRGGITNESTQI